MIPPEGGTTTLTDVRGQTTELRQHHQRAAEASYDTPTYACYDHDGNYMYSTSGGGGGGGGTTRKSQNSPAKTVHVTGKKGEVFIEDIRVPAARELAAMFPQYEEKEKQLEAWAERKCFDPADSAKAFCGAAEALGMIHHEQTLFDKIVVALVAPDFDSWKNCPSGDGLKACGWAATDLPWARVFKGAKLVKGCNSFVPGTEVLMADGTAKPVEDVEIGDEVLATDPGTGRTEVKTVTAEITGDGSKDLATITLAVDGEQVRITATDGHPFRMPGLGEWIGAGRLAIGWELRTAAGGTVRITDVDRWSRPATVHNLTVADFHTYYVLAGAEPVLVHNCGGMKASDQVRNLVAQGKTRDAADVHYEDMVRARTGGTSQMINGREVDVVTSEALIQVKRTWTAVNRPKNFLGKSTRNQIKATLASVDERGVRAEFWFKYGVHNDVRSYIENKGGIVRTGRGD